MEKLVILGAGGSGREIVETVHSVNEENRLDYEIVCFLDDNVNLQGATIAGYPVLGEISKFSEFVDCQFISSIGHPEKRFLREKIRSKVDLSDKYFPSLIHPRATVAKSAVIGPGTVIFAGSTVGADVSIGKHSFVNYNTSIGHESKVGDYSILASGVNLSGRTEIGDHVYVGAGSATKHEVKIGDNVLIGAGSVIIKDIKPNSRVLQEHRTFILPEVKSK